MLDRLRQLLHCGSSTLPKGTGTGPWTTDPGDTEGLPAVSLQMQLPPFQLLESFTGPGHGVGEVQLACKDLNISWRTQPSVELAPDAAAAAPGQSPSEACWGHSLSLYDRDPITGVRSGEPIADCYAGLLLPGGAALLVVADGVNWGPKPRNAARAAVYGCVRHALKDVLQRHGGEQVDSNLVVSALREAVHAAQSLILKCDATLTTLVASLIAPEAAAGKHRSWKGLKKEARGAEAEEGPRRYIACSIMVGDSPAYVWRYRQGLVEELTGVDAQMAPAQHRDPRMCPGCLGFALGESPDLSNMVLSVAALEEGDVVFLTSDGIADNFDPIVRKKARAASFGTSLPPGPGNKLTSCSFVGTAGKAPGAGEELPCGISPTAAHQLTLGTMATLLQQQQQAQQQGPLVPKLVPQQQPQALDTPFSQEQPLAAAVASPLSAQALGRSLLSFVTQLTQPHRDLVEQRAKRVAEAAAGGDQQSIRRMNSLEEQDLFLRSLANTPGKLDHATCVAFQATGAQRR